jgi:hypothetical protein
MAISQMISLNRSCHGAKWLRQSANAGTFDAYGKEETLPGVRAREGREEFPEGLISLEGINGWDIVDGNATISIDEIRHYSAKRCIEFFVVGNKPGKYVLKCKVMCAEYSTPVEQGIEVEVR